MLRHPQTRRAVPYNRRSTIVGLGDRVRDRISGFRGIATCRSTFLYGCIRISITPEETDKDGKVNQAEWFDEPQVEVLETAAALATTKSDKHGPREDVHRAGDARR